MKNKIPSVAKAVDLLLMLSDRGQRLRQSEIMQRLGVTSSTAYRILQTFAASGLVAKDSDKRWGVAPGGFLPLAYSMREEIGVLEHARKVIDALAYDQKTSCKITIRNGSRMVSVIYAYPRDNLFVEEMLSASHPLIIGPTGAALLCDEPEDVLLQLVRECGEDIPETRSPKILLAAVESIRRRGWVYAPVFNYMKFAPGKASNGGVMAAPIRSANGVVIAALSFMGPPEDFARGKQPALSKLLLASARACSNPAFVTRP